MSINANSANTQGALYILFSCVKKRVVATLDTGMVKLWPLSTMTQKNQLQWLNRRNKWRGGGLKPFYPRARWKKCQYVWWLVYVYVQYAYASKTQRCVSAVKEPFHSVLRVGVLGCLSPMVLHNQPAKSTSSTSDRLMNVWLCLKNK